uniref:Uncharacterized protein n=1 Tax=Streptomyces auratus AGR0001 TaxID=1160718 RepID=J1RPW7_9ACTN
MALPLAQQAGRAEQQDPRTVELRKGGVEPVLEGARGGVVGVGGLLPQGEQRIEVGDSGTAVPRGMLPKR